MLTRRKVLISAAALALSGRLARAQAWPSAVRAPDRALSGRRRRGRDRSHRRAAALRDVGPAGADREQGRRRRQHRVGCGGEVAARRLHDVSRRRIPHHQSARLSEAVLRSDGGPHAGHRRGAVSDRDRGAEFLAGQDRAGVHRLREGEARPHFRDAGPRHRPASRRRTVQARRRHRAHACALSRRRARAARI